MAHHQTPETTAESHKEIIEAIRTVYDPEIPVNVYDIGLIYEIKKSEEGNVHVLMTLTSPSCPSAEQIPVDVERAISCVDGIKDIKVDVVWEPTWTPDQMSEAAKLELGMF